MPLALVQLLQPGQRAAARETASSERNEPLVVAEGKQELDRLLFFS